MRRRGCTNLHEEECQQPSLSCTVLIRITKNNVQHSDSECLEPVLRLLRLARTIASRQIYLSLEVKCAGWVFIPISTHSLGYATSKTQESVASNPHIVMKITPISNSYCLCKPHFGWQRHKVSNCLRMEASTYFGGHCCQ